MYLLPLGSAKQRYGFVLLIEADVLQVGNTCCLWGLLSRGMGLSSQSKQVYNRLTNFPTITTICRSCLSQAVEVWVFLPTCPLVAEIEFPQYRSNSSSCFPDLNFQSVWSQEVQLVGWCFNPLTAARLYIKLTPGKGLQSLMEPIP